MTDETPKDPHFYRGWAPCVHQDNYHERDDIYKDVRNMESAFMDLIWMSGSNVVVHGDQWFGISVEGQVTMPGDAEDFDFKTFIQCDLVQDGVIETYRVWSEKYKELTGKGWDDE